MSLTAQQLEEAKKILDNPNKSKVTCKPSLCIQKISGWSVLFIWFLSNVSMVGVSHFLRYMDIFKMSYIPGFLNIFVYVFSSLMAFEKIRRKNTALGYLFLLVIAFSIAISYYMSRNYTPFGVIFWEIRKTLA